jgi:hypothetical protein
MPKFHLYSTLIAATSLLLFSVQSGAAHEMTDTIGVYQID